MCVFVLDLTALRIKMSADVIFTVTVCVHILSDKVQCGEICVCLLC